MIPTFCYMLLALMNYHRVLCCGSMYVHMKNVADFSMSCKKGKGISRHVSFSHASSLASVFFDEDTQELLRQKASEQKRTEEEPISTPKGKKTKGNWQHTALREMKIIVTQERVFL